MARVDLSSSAQKDLSKLLKTPAGAAIKRVIMQNLTTEPWPIVPRAGPRLLDVEHDLEAACARGVTEFAPRECGVLIASADAVVEGALLGLSTVVGSHRCGAGRSSLPSLCLSGCRSSRSRSVSVVRLSIGASSTRSSAW